MSISPVGDQPWVDPYAESPPPTRSSALRTVVTALAVAVGAAALGVPYALLWALAAPDVPVVKVDDGQAVPAEPTEQFVAGDGWFVLLGVAFGVVAAVAVWLLARRTRGPVVLVALAFGSVVAGVVAAWLGERIGIADYQQALAAAAPGTRLAHPPDLRVADPPNPFGVPLVAAFSTAVTYTLFAAWSRHDSLRRDTSAVAAAGESGQTPVSWGSLIRPDRPATQAPPEPGEAGPLRD